MAVKALANTGILYTDRRDFYVSPMRVQELYPSVSPFTTMLLDKGTREVKDPDFKMFEHRSQFLDAKADLNCTPAAWSSNTGLVGETVANLAVNNIKGLGGEVSDAWLNIVFEIWDSTKTTYKGVAFVSAVSGSTFTLKSMGNPRVSNMGCSALANNDILYAIGTAFGEGTEAPEAWSDDLSVVFNSTQIFKKSVEVTGTLYKAALRGYSKELERLRVEALKEMKYQMEIALLRGVRPKGIGSIVLETGTVDSNDLTSSNHAQTTLVDASGKTVRSTMGIISALERYGAKTGDKQNVFTLPEATYKYSDFVDAMEKVFQYLPDSGYKTAFCGAGALSYWAKMSNDSGFIKKSGWNIQMSKAETSSLGFNVQTIDTPHGGLKLVFAPGLRGIYNKYMVVVDESKVWLAEYRPFSYKTNIKTDNAYDGVKDQYMADMGLGIELIEAHSLFKIV
jgi:hypothetical protein